MAWRHGLTTWLTKSGSEAAREMIIKRDKQEHRTQACSSRSRLRTRSKKEEL